MHRQRNAYALILAAWMTMFLLSGCDPQTPPPTDSRYDAPLLTNLVLSDNVINTDTILVGSQALPDDKITIHLTASIDASGGAQPITFMAGIRSESGAPVGASFRFSDDGVSPDQIASDGTYTSEVSFELERTYSGVYFLEVSSTGTSGLSSNVLSGKFLLIRQNLPPFLSDLEADTVVSLSDGNSLLQLRVTVSDQNGLGDVERVWFDSFKPDGTPSGANPIIMFDDGNVSTHGDVSAGDGIYGLKVLFSDATLGTYRFSFRAIDRAMDSSNVIDHFLTVVP